MQCILFGFVKESMIIYISMFVILFLSIILLLIDLKSVLSLKEMSFLSIYNIPGRLAQSVTCLATDAYLTADPGVATRSHTFVEIDHEIISTVILLPSTDSFKKGCCQLQAKVCAQITGKLLVQACPGKSVVK